MNNLVNRALHTFYQAFVPVFLAGLTNLFNAFQHGGLGAGKSALVALVVSAVASGISAIKTAFLNKSAPSG